MSAKHAPSLFVVCSILMFGAGSRSSVIKCCKNESLSIEDVECLLPNNVNVPLSEVVDLSNETVVEYITCLADANSSCDKIPSNNTFVFQDCTIHQRCDNISTPLKFWGANIVALANMIYFLPYLLVVLMYLCMKAPYKRIYDRAVMYFCLTQVCTSFILCLLAYFVLCHKPLRYPSYALFGLTLMFLTISGMLWQLIICFDMTVTITRFEWAPANEATKQRDEDRKFFLYSNLVWGATILLTGFATFVEFTSFVPRDWIIKPQFEQFDAPNISVIMYVITVPILVCVANNILFFYTTYVIVKTRSNMVLRQNRQNQMKKYFFYMRLYLLMDAPWLSGALGSIFPDLWLFKFVRMSQPIAMLIAMLPRKKFLMVIKSARNCCSRKFQGEA